MPVQLCGEVCVSGFDISISYDSDVLQLKEILDKDEDVMVNSDEPGIIKLNFISTENTIGDVDMCKLKFIINSKTESTPIKIKVNSIYAFEDSKKLENDKLIKPEYYIVDSNVVVLP